MPKQGLISSMGMSEKKRFQYRKRAQQGDFYELPGAFGDSVFVPKSFGGPDPEATRLKNQLRLQWHIDVIKRLKETKGKGYRKGLFTSIPTV